MKFQLTTSASTLLLSTVPAALATGVTQYKCTNGDYCSLSSEGGMCSPSPLGLPAGYSFSASIMGSGSMTLPYQCIAFHENDLQGGSGMNSCTVTCPASCEITRNVVDPCHGQNGNSGSGTVFGGNFPFNFDNSGSGTVFDGNFPFGDNGNSGSGNMFGENFPFNGGSMGGDNQITGAFDPSLAAFSDMYVANPRGRNNNNNGNMRTGNAPFRNGQQVGVRQAQQTWQRLGGTCRSAWPSYTNAINRIIQRLQRARQTPRNQGRIAGLRQELQRRRRECNGRNPNPPRPRPNPRNPAVCIRFGEEAARRIAWDFCNPSPLLGSRQGSWRRDCRDVAINQCKGQVTTEVQNQCGLPRSTRTLRQLQDQCTDKVDSMIRSSSGRGIRGKTEKEMMLS